MSAVAALAVASPAAVVAVTELSQGATSGPQQREFVQAAMVTDLPNELISALSQGLSQFGINVPPLPTGLLTGSGATTSPVITSPGLATPGLATPGLTTPGLTAPGLTAPGLTAPGLTTPEVGVPPLAATGPALTSPGLTDAGLTNPALTNPALTSPTGATPGGLTTPPATLDPALASPLTTPVGLPGANEVPIAAPIGLDPAAGTYPILGDPSLAAMPASTGGGGLFGDLSSMANQLGAGQAIDLLKGMVMPAIMSAMKPGAVPGAPPAVPAVPGVPAPPAPAPLPGV